MSAFRQPAFDVAERMLGLLDRRPHSATFGCFDRSYWHYRMSDFPSAWFNNAVEYVALLVRSQGPWSSPVLRRWAEGAVNFSMALQQGDGSVSEAYPYEHGFCATAFLGAHTAAAIQLLGLPFDRRLLPMGEFVASDTRQAPANQLATAALLLARIARFTGEKRWLDEASRMLDRLAKSQAEDGGFQEYDGADIGYQSVTLSALAQIDAEGPIKPDPEVVARAMAFLSSRVRDDGTYDYRVTSRRTQFLFPFGLAYFGSDVVNRIQEGLRSGHMLRPSWLDDRYVADLATDYLRTAQLAECA